MSTKNNTLILGLGNYLVGDEGLGVHAVKYIEEQGDIPDTIDVIDGGTGGFHLLSLIESYKTIIMIDATLDDDKPGTLKVIEPKFAAEFPRTLTSHDIGLRDLLQSASLLGVLPKVILIIITISNDQKIGMELSKEIITTLPEIHKQVVRLLNN